MRDWVIVVRKASRMKQEAWMIWAKKPDDAAAKDTVQVGF